MYGLGEQELEKALRECAAEPIHQIGSIQPHGALLVLSADSRRIVLQSSDNLANFIVLPADGARGKRLADLLGDAAASQVEGLIQVAKVHHTAMGMLGVEQKHYKSALQAYVYVSSGLFVLEMIIDQGPHQETRLAELYMDMQQTLLNAESDTSVADYFNLIVSLVRTLTGFDSVMVYQFDTNWDGEVIAQSCVEACQRYLGQRFPASDIPEQARRLYTTNRVRVVADINATPVPILPVLNPVSGEPLDMTYSALRGLSPIHIQYLRNMGVQASMSISLLQDGRLWGLIVCHHLSAKPLSIAMHDRAMFISRVTTEKLSWFEAREYYKLMNRAMQIHGELLKSINQESEKLILIRLLPELQALLDASGLIIMIEGKYFLQGETPKASEIGVLLTWLASQPSSKIFSCDFLGALFPPAKAYSHIVSGLIAAPISTGNNNFIVWLRKEKPRTVQWAGNSRKGVVRETNGNYHLTPRKSFELWTEIWRGRCSTWTHVEIAIAQLLARAIPESLAYKSRAEQLHEMQRIAKDQAEHANQAKSVFLANMSHELRTPLHAMLSFARLGLEKTATSEAPSAKLREYFNFILLSGDRLLLLLNNLLDLSKLEARKMTLHVGNHTLLTLMESVKQELQILANNKGIDIECTVTPRDLCLECDSEKISQVLRNLLANAIKFSPVSSSIRISAGLSELPDRRANHNNRAAVLLKVRDEGIGIPEDELDNIFSRFTQSSKTRTGSGGTGLGLAICREIVELHLGAIYAENNPEHGASIVMLLPLKRTEQPSENR